MTRTGAQRPKGLMATQEPFRSRSVGPKTLTLQPAVYCRGTGGAFSVSGNLLPELQAQNQPKFHYGLQFPQ